MSIVEARDVGSDWRERPLVLVGLMGCGKTSVGKRLAVRLGRRFVDADDAIELAAGMSVREIFERLGEPAFRDGERRVIARLMAEAREPTVIATGGGAFVDADTRALILARGTAIWLDADVPTLVARTAKRPTRPLLVGRDPAAVLAELARVRNPLYAEAPIRVMSRSAAHEATVDAIIGALEAQAA
ncbi:shikimate kinase [Sandaracinobacteroides saxicola]|uniref:Shikimate kinase n=1 Tax=Sandaracinobacteroides saxicola TaxID=2759707 RepID=A0A7G5IJD5_9SPHN|nr:shikimate kinase [Sandaracinobacteroides saxicola]QMW23477.1 shikimate kinase [Sandaracinobacteroides saxicola]